MARETLRSGDVDAAIESLRSVLDREITCGGTVLLHARVGEYLVDALLARGVSTDIAEAQAVIDRIAGLPREEGLVLCELPLLRMRAMLAEARGDEGAYRRYRDRYRVRANELRFEGHIDTAAAMP